MMSAIFATNKHTFENRCLDFSELLEVMNLTHMVKVAHRQSQDQEAKRRYDPIKYKEYETKAMCPAYFGAWGEWFCQMYLAFYGDFYNITNIKMIDAVDSTEKDLGIDGIAKSMRKGTSPDYAGRRVDVGSPVFIQVKTTLNPLHEYQANDGSRLTNFIAHAATRAIQEGRAYQARYILFTTGKSIGYTLNAMTNNVFEVINFNAIVKRAKGNNDFLNFMRERVGLLPLVIQESKVDDEFTRIVKEQENGNFTEVAYEKE